MKTISRQLAQFWAKKFFPHLGIKYGVRCICAAIGIPHDTFEK